MFEVREDFKDLLLSAGLSQAEIQNIPDEEFGEFVSALFDSPRIPNNRAPPAVQPRNNPVAHPVANRSTLPDGFGNRNLSEEEAYRLAIEQSLDDQLIPPHMRPIPEPENEVGYHPQRRAASNRQDLYNFDRKTYPKYPNPEPTPLPRQTTTKRTQGKLPTSSKYESHYEDNYTPKSSTRTTTKTTKQKTSTRTTPKTGTRKTIQTDLESQISNITSTKPAVRGRNPTNQYNPRTRFDQHEIAPPKSKPSLVVTNSANPKTTTTSTNPRKTPITSSRGTSQRTTSSRGTSQRTTSSRGTSQRTTSKTKEAVYDAIMPKPEPTSYQRHTTKSNVTSTKPSSINIQSHYTSNISNQRSNDKIQYNRHPIQSTHQTFPAEAILDPTSDILHPSHMDDDERLFEWADNLPIKKPIQSNQKAPMKKAQPPPPPVYEDPFYLPEEFELPKPKPLPPPKPEPSLTDSQKIRNLQNMEYIMAQQEAERKEREEAEQKAEIQRKEEQEKRMQQNKFTRAKSLYEKLPAEPPDEKGVVTVKVQTPDGQGIVRRFLPDRPGNDIYVWISGRTLDMPEDERLYPDSFELKVTFGQVVDKNQTLAEQNIKGRVFLAISEL